MDWKLHPAEEKVRQYEWEFVLEEDCHLYAELGLLLSLDPPFNKKLSDHELAEVVRFDGDIVETKESFSWSRLLKNEKQRLIPGSRVSFALINSAKIEVDSVPLDVLSQLMARKLTSFLPCSLAPVESTIQQFHLERNVEGACGSN
jgi:hypothetical protein